MQEEFASDFLSEDFLLNNELEDAEEETELEGEEEELVDPVAEDEEEL